MTPPPSPQSPPTSPHHTATTTINIITTAHTPPPRHCHRHHHHLVTISTSLPPSPHPHHLNHHHPPPPHRNVLRVRLVVKKHNNGAFGLAKQRRANKWVWRFHVNRSALWSRFIRALHGECGGLVKGEKAGHISEKWRGDMSFKEKYPRVFALESNKKVSVSNKMHHIDINFSLRRIPRDGVEMEQFNALKLFLAGTTLSNSNDRWSWSLAGSREFSVASVRKHIDDLRLGGKLLCGGIFLLKSLVRMNIGWSGFLRNV
nr:hypothetical protein [Tanacetum cinerariifolium]